MLLDDRYELLGHLDRGGMATVYRAHDRRLDRSVAIKVLESERQDEAGSAFREDRLTARLAHPHIVGVYDGGLTPDGRPFLVMELIEGQSITALAPLPLGQALRVGELLASAVAYTHEQGIIHCDIKPQNVLLDAHGQAKLADFGVANADRAPTGMIVYGSAPYIAPERLRGLPVGPAVDIYALGATLFFLLTGQPPYRGQTTDEIVGQVVAGPPRPLTEFDPTVPTALAELVQRSMAPDPADRPSSAAAFGEALAAIRRAAGEPTSALHVAPDPTATTAVLRPPPAASTAVLPTPAAPTTTTMLAMPQTAAGLGHSSNDRSDAAIRLRKRRYRHRWLMLALAALLAVVVAIALARPVLSLRTARATPVATVAVPTLLGLDVGQARDQLRARGLVLGKVDSAPLPGQPANSVVYQQPAAGTQVNAHTTVDIVIRTTP